MENNKEYKLHLPSEEQLEIIKALKTNNVVVQVVVGSGKTTTTLHIAEIFNNKKNSYSPIIKN